MAEIEKIQRAAQQHEETVRELGVFVLWSNPEGDAWLLEISESDAVQVARGGEALEAPINENPETIEINWSHTFTIRDKQLFVTTYADKVESCVEAAPTKRISAAIRTLRPKGDGGTERRIMPCLLQSDYWAAGAQVAPRAVCVIVALLQIGFESPTSAPRPWRAGLPERCGDDRLARPLARNSGGPRPIARPEGTS